MFHRKTELTNKKHLVRQTKNYVGFEDRSTVAMKSKLCSQVKVNRRFGGTDCFHLQGCRVIHIKNKHEASELNYITSLYIISTVSIYLTMLSELL
jgi:hypothetical protein